MSMDEEGIIGIDSGCNDNGVDGDSLLGLCHKPHHHVKMVALRPFSAIGTSARGIACIY